MANTLSITIKEAESRLSFLLTETSGAYTSINTGGWGSPNNTIAQALTAVAEVYKRDADTGSFDLLGSVDVFDDLPSSSGGTFTILASDVDSTLTTFEDGIYKIKYIVTGVGLESVPFEYSTQVYVVFDMAIRCCIAQKGAKVAVCCTNALQDELEDISFMYQQLEKAKCCGDYDIIQNHLDYLTNKCSGCGCC